MPTATREQFVDAANIIWKNHGVYLWGGNGEATATHTGIYAGNLMVIEMQGRDRGCVKRKISEGAWVCGGSLPYIK